MFGMISPCESLIGYPVNKCFFFKRILCICVELTELFQFSGRTDPITAQEYKVGL